MKATKKLRSMLALLLCAALLLTCLTGCHKKAPEGDDDDRGDQEVPADEPVDPKELLSEGFEATRTLLSDRIKASRLQPLLDLADMEDVTADFTVGWPDQEGNVAGTISGTGVVDRDSGAALFDGNLADPETNLKLYYSPEFIGLGSDTLFDPGTFYGLRPTGLREQLEGSDLADLIDLDIDALGALDAFLEALPHDTRPKVREALNQIIDLTRTFLRDHEPEIASEDGEGGYTITMHITAGEAADYAAGLNEILPWFDFSESIESLRSSGVEVPAVFTLADGKLTHVSAQVLREGADPVNLEAEFYGANGNTVEITLEPNFVLTMDLGGDIHMSLSSMTSVQLDWAADGTLSFNMYTTDVTDFALEGSLTTDGGVVSYDGIWYRGERGDRNPLSLSIREGGAVTAPEVTKNLTEMTERQLYILAMKILLRFGK